jgi:hypothetical protein
MMGRIRITRGDDQVDPAAFTAARALDLLSQFEGCDEPSAELALEISQNAGITAEQLRVVFDADLSAPTPGDLT